MGGLLHLVQRGRPWAGPQPARSLLAVPKVTALPSTASIPITVLRYSSPLHFGFNVSCCKFLFTVLRNVCHYYCLAVASVVSCSLTCLTKYDLTIHKSLNYELRMLIDGVVKRYPTAVVELDTPYIQRNNESSLYGNTRARYNYW